jgi:hypothetical protein
MAEPLLVKATLRAITGNDDGDDRDHDTGINVEVRTVSPHTDIAKVHCSQRGGEYGYAQRTTNEFEVTLSPGARTLTKTQCQNFEFRIGIHPNGSDRWKFDAWLILWFDDGSTIWNDKIGQNVEVNDAFRDCNPDPDAGAAFQCGWNFSQVQPPPPLR